MKLTVRVARNLRRRISLGPQRGFAMVVVLMILVMMSALGAGYLLSTATESQISRIEVDRMVAQNLAESGLAWAVNRIVKANWLRDIDMNHPFPCYTNTGDQLGHYFHTTATDGAAWQSCPGDIENFTSSAPLADQMAQIADHQFRGSGATAGPGELSLLPRNTGFRVWAERDDIIQAWKLNSIGYSGDITARSELTFRQADNSRRFAILADRYIALNNAWRGATNTISGGMWSNGELDISSNVVILTDPLGSDGVIGENPATGTCDDEYVAALGHFSNLGDVTGNVFTTSADGIGPNGEGNNAWFDHNNWDGGNSFSPFGSHGTNHDGDYGTHQGGTLYLMQAWRIPIPLVTNSMFETIYERHDVRAGGVAGGFNLRFNPLCFHAPVDPGWPTGSTSLDATTAGECDPTSSGLWHFHTHVDYDDAVANALVYCAKPQVNCGESASDHCGHNFWDSPWEAQSSSCVNPDGSTWSVDSAYVNLTYDELTFGQDPPLSNVLLRKEFPELNYDFLADLARGNHGTFSESTRPPGFDPLDLDRQGTYFVSWEDFNDYITQADGDHDLVWDPTELGNPDPTGKVRTVGDPSRPSVFYIADINHGGPLVKFDTTYDDPELLRINGYVITDGWIEFRLREEWSGTFPGRTRKINDYLRVTLESYDPLNPNLVKVFDGVGRTTIASDFTYPAIAAKKGIVIYDMPHMIDVLGLIYTGDIDSRQRFVDQNGVERDDLGRIIIDVQNVPGPVGITPHNANGNFFCNGAIVGRDVVMNTRFNVQYNPEVLRTQGFVVSKHIRDIQVLDWRLAAD